ncbi:C-C motif chemokine 4-like [Brachyistius frenatus]|uniref:C-C motif chemokine 4-like n=1 Tax=Brachyistius frenatus TaxID=100188 RepID=UPI0037E760B8
MASPRLALSVVVLLLAAVAMTEALRGAGRKKCCHQFKKTPVPKGLVTGYFKTSQICSKAGIMLKMATGRQLCVRPSDPWVQKLVSYLDAKSTPGKMSNL